MAALHALDATPIEEALIAIAGHQAGGVAGLLDHYGDRARLLNDTALIKAVEDLARTCAPVDRRVVCHGDLHPFNILNNDGALTVLDWTAARVADPAYDVAFTALLLANPPLSAPAALQPIISKAGRVLSRRFIRAYRAMTGGIGPDDTSLEWHTKLHATRILLDITEWRTAGVLEHHRGHPWLAMENVVRRALDRRTAAA
jgi:aminoglycoside phosphotransferase (APT) family kinase protein